MMTLRHKALALLSLVMCLLMALTPAMAADQTIAEMGDALREAQSAFDAADASYDELCEMVFDLQERYDNGSEKEKLKVQDQLIDAMISEEEAYSLLDECTASLEALQLEHLEMLEDADLTEHKLSARGYDSKLTIVALLDEENVIWNVTVEVDGDERDKGVSESSFLIQFIGRELPLSTDKKDADCIMLLSDARVTSEAVVDALNSLEKSSSKESGSKTHQTGPIIEPQDIADYIFEHGELPENFITKKEAQALGWDSSWNYVSDVAPGYSIGGDRFGNYEGLLPDKKGRQWYEADCFYTEGKRNAYRILYSNDGLVYYTDDHYESFTQMFPSWE